MSHFILNAYTDGSYSKNKPEIYGWSSIIYQNENVIKTLNGVGDQFIESWQIGGECEAVLQTMKHILNHIDNYNISVLNIHYDYIGIEKWAEKQWKAKKDVSKEYVKEFDKLKRELLENDVNVFFVKVKGHSGNEGNELADQKAKEAIDNYYNA